MRKAAEVVAAAAVLAALAIAATYPLAFELRRHIASDVGDPVLVSWILAWDADRIRHGLTGIWDAPNFYPYHRTLLYSEHFLGVALFTAPLQWASRNPVLVYNVAFLASYVISGVGMYVLARLLTGRRDAALVAAVVFAFQPFRASHSAHLQLLVIGWLPLSLWGVHRYFRTERLRDLLAAAVFFLLQALTSGYFAYFGLVPLLLVAAWEFWRRRSLPARFVAHAAIAGAIAIAVMLPVVRAYAALRQESGLRRPVEEITIQSADVGDYVSASPTLRIWGGLGRGRGEHELFPGSAAIILALLSFRARRHRGPACLYGAMIAVAFLLSLGPAPRSFGHAVGFPGPYALALRVVPGLDGIRVPARLAVVVQLALAVLAGFGTTWLMDRMASRSPRFKAAAIAAIVACVAAEGWPRLGVPPFDPDGEPREREAYAYLKSLPRGAALELPTSATHLLDEFRYQYMTLIHRHPIVNGHSGYVTPLAIWLRGGHSPLHEIGRQRDAVEMTRAIGVRYLVVHRAAYEDDALRDELLRVIDEDPQVLAHRTFGDVTIAVLTPFETANRDLQVVPVPAAAVRASASDAPDRLPFLFDGDRDSRWLTARPQSGDEWLQLELDRPRNIRVVRLQLGTRSFGDYPRDLAVEAIEDEGSRTLFRGSVLPQFAHGVIVDGEYPFIDIVLPPNHAKMLRLSQHGKTHTFFWSIHELQLLEPR